MEIFSWILFVLFMLSGFITIAMAFYLGRHKVKEIDRLVYGYEIAGDSIFFQIMRIPHYGDAFAWHFYARRCHLLPIRDHFDKKFQRPFMVTSFFAWIGIISMIIGVILDKFFLHIT